MRGNPLTVHHVKPKCQYPELERDPDNCVLWHSKYHTEYHKQHGYPTPTHKKDYNSGRKREKPKDKKRRLRREAKNKKRR